MIHDWVLTYVLIVVRVVTFLSILPLFGRRTLPKTVVIGLGLGLSTLWFCNYETPPITLSESNQYVGWLQLWVWTFREMMIGGLLGLAFGIFIYPLQIAGSYLAQEMGLSIASLSDPSTNNNSDVITSLFQTIGLLIFFVGNFHHFIFATLHQSFARIPLAQGFLFQSLENGFEGFASVDQSGLSLIAPIVICLFVILVILLFLTKAAPTMNLFSVGLSVRIFAGLCFLVIFAPNLLNGIHTYFESGQHWIEGFMESL